MSAGTCKVCRAPTERSTYHHCSPACAAELRRRRQNKARAAYVPKPCAHCRRPIVYERRNKWKYCSVQCAKDGRALSVEALESMGGNRPSLGVAEAMGYAFHYIPPSNSPDWPKAWELVAEKLPLRAAQLDHLSLNALVWADERRLARFDGKYWRKAR